jgi:hypothetical protein
VDLYISSPIRLHGVVLNYLSTGTTLPVFTFTLAVIAFTQYPLSRGDGSVVYNCCWASPAQSFSGPSPAGLMTTCYCLRFETPQPGGSGPRIYIPQEQGGPVIPPSTSFPFRRLGHLLWLHCSGF